jgi:uncharacterized protein YjbI with pentapeptide repeats
MPAPLFIDDPAYRDLRSDDLVHFVEHTASREEVDFSNADLRGVDLRRIEGSKLVLRGAYLRDADLRGLDLRHIDMEGCTLLGAHISGTYFPDNMSAQEIMMSIEHGTRLRANG